MTHTATYIAVSLDVAEQIAASFGMTEPSLRPGTMSANYRGRTVERAVGSVEFSLYASNGDHGLFERDFNARNRASAASTAPAATMSADPATPKQVSYLNSLIRRDPGAAMTIGASVDGAVATPGLTKSQASRMIETLNAGV